MAVPWLAGTLVALWLVPPEFPVLAIMGLAAVAAVIACVRRRAWPLWLIAAVVWAWLRIDAQIGEQLAAPLAGTDLRVSGWVDDFPRRSAGQVGFSLAVAGAGSDAALPRRLRLTWYDPPLEISAGMSLDLTVRLKRPHGLANPGSFDYERWLFIEGYGATGYVRSGQASNVAVESVARAWRWHWRRGFATSLARGTPRRC